MSKSPKFGYKQAFHALLPIVDLKIIKNKVNFSSAEKAKITNAVKALTKEGLIYFDEEKNKFVQQVKFVKTGKKEKVKGIKNSLNGRFVRGARANQKMRGNTIVGANFDKIFIPLDISSIEEQEDDETDIEHFVQGLIFDALGEYYEELSKMDYFTVSVANGWEIGRGKLQPQNYPKKKIQITEKSGRKIYKKVTDKEATFDRKDALVSKFSEGQAGKRKKVESVTRYIAELIERIHNRNVRKYKLGLETISGLYLYKFKKQRKPTKKELSKIKGKKRK